MASLRPLQRSLGAALRSGSVATSVRKPSTTTTTGAALYNFSTQAPRSGPTASSFSRRPRTGLAVAISFSLALAAYSLNPSTIFLEAAPQPAAASLLPPNTSSGDEYHIDPATSQRLPMRIDPPSSLKLTSGDKDEPFFFLASGVRTVSFLRVQVYVAALYVPGRFEEFMRQHIQSGSSKDQSLEQTMIYALEAGIPVVLKVVPVRNTDFAHLRDGFTRAVQARQKLLRKSPSPPNEEQEESLSLSLQRLKECFPKTSLKKGEHLDLVFQPSRTTSTSSGRASESKGVDLTFEHDKVVLGTVQYDTRSGNIDVAKLLFQAYVADKDPVSEVFKKAVLEKIFPADPTA